VFYFVSFVVVLLPIKCQCQIESKLNTNKTGLIVLSVSVIGLKLHDMNVVIAPKFSPTRCFIRFSVFVSDMLLSMFLCLYSFYLSKKLRISKCRIV